MGKNLILALTYVGVGLVSGGASAELNVIADMGGQDVKGYFTTQNKWSKTKPITTPSNPVAYMQSVFPIVTTKMTLGPVGPNEGPDTPSYSVVRPIFIIGDDPTSLKWLATNTDRFVESGAVGLVVNVKTPARMNAIRAIAGKNLMITAVSGDDMAEAMNIQHYPFYMDREGVLR